MTNIIVMTMMLKKTNTNTSS